MPLIRKKVATRRQEVTPPSSPAEASSGASSEVASPVVAPQQSVIQDQIRKKKKKESYKRYLYMVLKQIHVHLGISSKGMQTMNDLVMDMFERIVSEATHLRAISKRSTLSSNDIEAACKLIIPGELAKHAVNEGNKAVTKYNRSKD